MKRKKATRMSKSGTRWERLMLYLADLQLTYSTGWGANGCGDQELYGFVTGLIEELEGWEEGEKPEYIPDSTKEAILNVLDAYADETLEVEHGAYERARYAMRKIIGGEQGASRTEFREGQYVVYVNGDKYEIGRIKTLRDDGAFVAYHEGETGAKTPYDHMHPFMNEYVIKNTSLAEGYFNQRDEDKVEKWN